MKLASLHTLGEWIAAEQFDPKERILKLTTANAVILDTEAEQFDPKERILKPTRVGRSGTRLPS